MAVALQVVWKCVGSLHQAKCTTVRLVHTVQLKSEEELKKRVRNYCDNYKYRLGAVQCSCNVGHSKIANKVPEDYEPEDYFKYSESFSQSKVWNFQWLTENNKTLGIDSKTMFWKGYEVLEKYAENEPLTSQENTALLSLRRFLLEKGKHEQCLKSLKTKTLSETGVASLLTQHFLAQLLPYPTNFYLDKDSLGKTDGCPCGCGGLINYGLTAVGSPQLFYGSADILVFPSQRAFFGSKDDTSTAAFMFMKSEKSERHGHVTDGDEWCQELDILKEGINTRECEKQILESSTADHQLLKQAISLSMCKQISLLNGRKDDSAENATNSSACILPVCGITSSTYDIAMYDTKNDYLLKMYKDDPEIFDGDEIVFSTIIDIWMIIYHQIFCIGPPEAVQDELQGTCRLLNQIGLERYVSVLENSEWLCRIEGPQQRSFGKPDLELLNVKDRLKEKNSEID